MRRIVNCEAAKRKMLNPVHLVCRSIRPNNHLTAGNLPVEYTVAMSVLRLLQDRTSRFWPCPSGRLARFRRLFAWSTFSHHKCESVSMNSLMFAWVTPGPMEMLIILAIFLLLFGGRQLPSLMKNLGASAREFKKGVQGMDEELDDATRSLKDDKSE